MTTFTLLVPLFPTGVRRWDTWHRNDSLGVSKYFDLGWQALQLCLLMLASSTKVGTSCGQRSSYSTAGGYDNSAQALFKCTVMLSSFKWQLHILCGAYWIFCQLKWQLLTSNTNVDDHLIESQLSLWFKVVSIKITTISPPVQSVPNDKLTVWFFHKGAWPWNLLIRQILGEDLCNTKPQELLAEGFTVGCCHDNYRTHVQTWQWVRDWTSPGDHSNF